MFNDIFNNVSGITYNMVTSFIGVKHHFQQCVRYNVEHGDQFYWCLMTFFNNVLGITYNMVTSFIGVKHHFQQCVSYNVEHGDPVFLVFTTLSTKCQV